MTPTRLRSLRHVLDVISVLVLREQKSRYKSTGMGVVWAVASPVLFLLTFYLLLFAQAAYQRHQDDLA